MWLKNSLTSRLTPLLFKNKYLFIILILAAALRFINLSHPADYIFDEVYHAFTAREYLHGNIDAWEWWTTPPKDVAYEWTHPPVAKYGMELGMLIFGENSFGWRFGSAVFGVLSILGLYLFIHAFVHRSDIALISAFLVSIEGLHVSQSRIAMNDIYMLCFFIWSLYAAVKMHWKSAAILYGLALASKWSALYGVVPLALIYLNQVIFSSRVLSSSRACLRRQAKSRDPSTLVGMTIGHILKLIRLLLISLAVYILTFAPFILAGHTWAQWWELHRQMWYYHTHLVATHGYQSTPIQWIFDLRPVWYYVKYGDGSLSNIYALGNPLILWLGLVAVFMQIKKILSFKYSLFLLSYLIFTVPWFFSPRIMFFYHYLPSSVFLCVILATWMVSLPKRSMWLTILLCAISYILISPMLYGFHVSTHYWDMLFKLIPSWK